jgi:hypothetical protein
MEDLWAGDRRRVALVVSVQAKPGVGYDVLRDAVFAVSWDARRLEWCALNPSAVNPSNPTPDPRTLNPEPWTPDLEPSILNLQI